MRIDVRAGTTEKLERIGVRNEAANHSMPWLPRVTKPWMHNKAFFKLENDVVNIGLGRGDALEIFNCNIVGCGRVR